MCAWLQCACNVCPLGILNSSWLLPEHNKAKLHQQVQQQSVTLLSVLNPEFTFDFFERSLSKHFYPYTTTAAGGRLEVGKYLKRFNGFFNDFSEAVPSD